MKKRNHNFIVLIVVILGSIAVGAVYLFNTFCRSFAPDKIVVTKVEITSSRGFVNPITIEKLKVDSLGREQRPVKYTIEYVTTCSIQQKDGNPPVALKKISLVESGRYSWSQENVNIQIVHPDGYSKRIRSSERLIWSSGDPKFESCPLVFEKESWYFINLLDPQIVGVYVYIDSIGNLHRYTTYSGVSPI
jgi:hypothetical protein